MSEFVKSLLIPWDKNAEYAERLVGDLNAEQMIHQPGEGMNHPAWIVSHLNAYHPVLVAMLNGQTFDDPKGHKFGMQSKPESDASIYQPKDQLMAEFTKGHNEVRDALNAAGDNGLSAAMTLERWKGPFPTVGSALGYLMVFHESTHLGQLSAWRRVQGLPSV